MTDHSIKNLDPAILGAALSESGCSDQREELERLAQLGILAGMFEAAESWGEALGILGVVEPGQVYALYCSAFLAGWNASNQSRPTEEAAWFEKQFKK